MGELNTLWCPITEDLGMLRQRVRAFVTAAGFPQARRYDVLLVVNEAVANVLEHGSGFGSVLAQVDAQDVWLEVFEPMGTLTMAQFHTHLASPPVAGLGGVGLWMISQLSDEVMIDHPGDGSRLRMRLCHSRPATETVKRDREWKADLEG